MIVDILRPNRGGVCQRHNPKLVCKNIKHVLRAVSFTALFSVSASMIFAETQIKDLHLNTLPQTQGELDRIQAVTTPPSDFATAQRFEENAGGKATARTRDNADAFSQPSANLSFEDQLNLRVGNGLFRKLWVSSRSSTLASDGLGPLLNARSCQRCHIKDGRGHTPNGPDDNNVSFLLRIAVPDPDRVVAEISEYFATLPDPTYGNQLQDEGLAGHRAEVTLVC